MMPSYFDRFTVPSTGWLAIKFPIPVKAWTWWLDTGDAYARGLQPASYILLDEAAVVDAGGGKVQIAAADSYLTIGDSIIIPAGVLDNYVGTKTLTGGTTDDVLEFADTYVAETVGANAVIKGYRDAKYTNGYGDAEESGREVWPANETLFYLKGVSGTVYANFRIVG